MPHFDQAGGTHRHMVNVEPGTHLEDIYGALELRVNSMHHQAVDKVGKKLRVAARAPDGVVEAIETTDDTWFCIGVQWHPEAETASALDRQIFDCLVQAATRYCEPALVETSA
jgi:putative glutamine amidotransferase